jgi:hypothetical protein
MNLQKLIDKHEAEKLVSYMDEFLTATQDAHRYKDEGNVEKFYEALLRRKELRTKIAHAKICAARTKDVRN